MKIADKATVEAFAVTILDLNRRVTVLENCLWCVWALAGIFLVFSLCVVWRLNKIEAGKSDEN